MVTKRKNEVRPGNYYCNCLLLCLQEEQNTVSLSKLLEVVNTVRSFGNRCFNQSHYDNAKRRYKEVKTERPRPLLRYWLPVVFLVHLLICVLLKGELYCVTKIRYFILASMFGRQALTLLENRETEREAEKDGIRTALLPLFLNLSITELRLDSPHKALKYGNKALEIDSANTKALFRCGQVRQGFFFQTVR